MRRTPLKRSRLRPKRATPRRRESPHWDADQWGTERLALLGRAGMRCECCGKALDAVEIHHRIRRRDGGDRASNLLALLPACHAHWTAHPAEAKARGLILPPWADPLAVPVLHAGTRWTLLGDDGELIRLGLDASWRLVA